jgi:hypothetical protein
MKRVYFFGVILLVLAISSCSNQANKQTVEDEKEEYVPLVIKPEHVESITMNDSVRNALIVRGREVSIKAKMALKKELQNAIKKDGLEYAISFCSERAMEIMDSIGQAEQVMVKRLAKKNRNPLNEMSENTSNLYKGFVIQSLNSNRVPAQVGWDEEGRPVYYKIIYTDALCLNCHGEPGVDINPKVAEKIAKIYPDDKAINFKDGHPRGMWAVTFPEYKVVKVENSKVSR